MTDGVDDVCTALAETLRSGVDVHRCAAAQALGALKYEGAVAPLIEALRDEDEDVRTDAATALALYSGEQVAAELLNNLIGDPNMDVKAAAIKGLVAMASADVIPWLHRIVQGRDAEIAWDEEEFYSDGWDSWVDLQLEAIIGLGALHDETAVPVITAAIDDEMGQDLSEAGFKALARLGQPGVAALANYLKTGDARARRRVTVSLGLAEAEIAGPILCSALWDKEAEVRLAAVRTLAALNPADPALIPLFSDSNRQVRAHVVRLAGMQNPEPLLNALSDPAPNVRAAVMETLKADLALADDKAVLKRVRAELAGDHADPAAQAARLLGAVRPVGALEDLAAQLDDTTRPEQVRLAAVEALAQIADETAVEVLACHVGDASRQVRMDVMVALASLAQAEPSVNAGTEILLAALRGELVVAPDPDEEQPDVRQPDRQQAGEEHVAVPTDEANAQSMDAAEPTPAPGSTLAAILGDNSPEFKVLKRAGDNVELSPRDLEFLGLAQNKMRKRRVAKVSSVAPHQDVRRFSARVLGDLATPAVMAALTSALLDDDNEVRLISADSLVRHAEKGASLPVETRDALAALTNHTERALRLSGIRGLGKAQAKEQLPLIKTLLADGDAYVRTDALRSLAQLGETNDDAVALLGDIDPSVRLAAAEAMAAVQRKKSVPALVDFAFRSEGYHRKATARLLRGLDIKAATEGFLAVLNDPDRRREWLVSIESLAVLYDAGQAAISQASTQSV